MRLGLGLRRLPSSSCFGFSLKKRCKQGSRETLAIMAHRGLPTSTFHLAAENLINRKEMWLEDHRVCVGVCPGGTGLCCQDLPCALALCLVQAIWGACGGEHHQAFAIHDGKHSISNFLVFKCHVNGYYLHSPEQSDPSMSINQNQSPEQIYRLQQQP